MKFITLTQTDSSGETQSTITINVASIVTMTDAYIVGRKNGGTTIRQSFTGTDVVGIHVAESRDEILAMIRRARQEV